LHIVETDAEEEERAEIKVHYDASHLRFTCHRSRPSR